MSTEINKLLKGFSIKEIEEILFRTAVGIKKVNKKEMVFPELLIPTLTVNIHQKRRN